jgi:hypothetical protein
VRLLLAALLLALPACDAACLAQSDLFAYLREPLIEECCLCLARRGTRFPGASCEEAFVGADGGVVVPGDAGIHPDAGYDGDDLDDAIQEGEVPCLCDGLNAQECKGAMNAGTPIVVVGACVSQGTGVFSEAPCEQACKDVLVFEPLEKPAE